MLINKLAACWRVDEECLEGREPVVPFAEQAAVVYKCPSVLVIESVYLLKRGCEAVVKSSLGSCECSRAQKWLTLRNCTSLPDSGLCLRIMCRLALVEAILTGN